MKTIYYLALILLIYSASVYSQVTDNGSYKYWFDAGLGIYEQSSKSDGFSFYSGINFVKGNTIYKAEYINMCEYNLFGASPSEEFHIGGLMIGKEISVKFIQLYFTGGLGVLSGFKRGKSLYKDKNLFFNIKHYEKDNFIVPSIPLETGITFTPIKYIGIGFSLWGNINYKTPSIGYRFIVGIGKLR